MKRTWLYLKKIKKQKKSFWDILILGLLFEIAWIIPGIDIFSFITPICEKTNGDLPLPFQIIQVIFTYPILDSFTPCVLSPFLGFIARINTFNIAIFVILSAIISVLYIFFHCKIYNVVLKRFLNPDKDLKIKELYAEKTDYLKKYYNWELICFGIKFFISLPLFIWTLSFTDLSSVGFESILIAIIVCLVFSLFNLYIILTRAFVIPVFMSGKYQEISSKNIFELSKKIFSIKLIVPILIIATVYILANILVLVGTAIIFVISFEYISLFILNLLLWILGVVILSIFTYYVGSFCLGYCISSQEIIFPDCPLILTKEKFVDKVNIGKEDKNNNDAGDKEDNQREDNSENGNIESVYSVFEKK